MPQHLDSLIYWADRLLATFMAAMATRLYRTEVQSVLKAVDNISSVRFVKCLESDVILLGRALVAGEDRRFYSHPGIDTKGMVRALMVRIRGGSLQGASTITQQLVRVLTADYRLSVGRKAKEMCLACAIDRKVTKDLQISTYLKIGYFGWRMTGCDQAVTRLRLPSPLSRGDAALVIARLRYPEPQNPSGRQTARINMRAAYIASRMSEVK